MVVYVGWLQQTLSVCQAVICISLIGSIYSCVVRLKYVIIKVFSRLLTL